MCATVSYILLATHSSSDHYLLALLAQFWSDLLIREISLNLARSFIFNSFQLAMIFSRSHLKGAPLLLIKLVGLHNILFSWHLFQGLLMRSLLSLAASNLTIFNAHQIWWLINGLLIKFVWELRKRSSPFSFKCVRVIFNVC